MLRDAEVFLEQGSRTLAAIGCWTLSWSRLHSANSRRFRPAKGAFPGRSRWYNYMSGACLRRHFYYP